MSTKEYAGDDLPQIECFLKAEGWLEVTRDNDSVTLYKPFDEVPQHDCVQIVIWPRAEGGFWSEEY